MNGMEISREEEFQQIQRAAGLSASPCEAHWYVAQTCAHHEKRVAEQLDARCIEHFLPLYETVSHWKDRRVRLQLPLFAGYIFVRVPLRELLRALQIPGVARFVGFGGMPVPIPDHEMEALRGGLTSTMHIQPHPYLVVGRRVYIKSGPLVGLNGILLRKKAGFRFVLSVGLIQRSVAADVEIADIEPLG